jgi:Xaa-Pro dipeptidase
VLIGENSSFPHGHAGNRKLKIGDALLFDFGCVYNGYHSDFTRTYFFKEVSDSFRKIYAVVKEANEIGRNLVKIGTSLHEVDDRVTKYLEDSPYSKFIGHRTGHGLGMEIHEDPSVVRGNYLNLQNGMVITIEPGLYDKGNVGIRIEDSVVVTENGHESLTALSRELIVL